MGEQIEVVAKNVVQHGEGPCWDDVTQSLYYVDVMKHHVLRYNSITGQNTSQSIGDSMCTMIVPRTRGGLVVTTRTEVGLLDSWDDSKLQIISTLEKEPNMLNDGKVDASGRLWVGSCYYGGESDPSTWPRGQGHLYSLGPDHFIKQHIGGISISNGMDWTNDNRTMYFIDSEPRHIMAFDFDLAAGQISNRRLVTSFGPSENPELRFPDGMTIDVEGKLWVAGYDDGRIVRLDPQTGKILRSVTFPVKRITSCCFGGKDFSDLYVTTSTFHLTPAELQTMPLAGSVFRVKGLGVKGRKANKYGG